MDSRKKYLVTGGTGFIGSALVKRLLKDGHAVRVLDDNSRGASRRLADVPGQFEMFDGDIRDADAVVEATKGVDSICHLAFVNGTEFFYTKPDLVLDVGVRGMLNVIDAGQANNVPELILASSSEVYQTPAIVPTDETVALSIPDVSNPRYSYGGGKLISEIMALHWASRIFQRVVIFRPHNVYGPDMGREHVIPQFAIRLAEAISKQPAGVIDFPIQGTGDETRAFIHVNDFIDGVRIAMERGQHLGIYHVGTDVETSIAEVARAVAGTLGRSINIIPGELQPGGTKRRCPNIGKLRSLGFNPQTTLADGLALTVPYYQTTITAKAA